MYIAGIRAERLRKKGLRKLMSGAYEQAGRCFQKAYQIADNTENLFNLGLYFIHSRNYQEAKDIFLEISLDYPENEINGLLLFESYMLLEKWEDAVEQIVKLTELNPRAKKYQVLKVVAEDVVAREKYRKVKILKSEGQAQIAKKNFAEALLKYEEAEKFSPADSEILNNIGGILLRMNDYVRAYTYFENALKLEPENPKIRKNLVQVKTKLRSSRKRT